MNNQFDFSSHKSNKKIDKILIKKFKTTNVEEAT